MVTRVDLKISYQLITTPKAIIHPTLVKPNFNIICTCVVKRASEHGEESADSPRVARIVFSCCLINNAINNNVSGSGVKALGILLRHKVIQPGVLVALLLTLISQVLQMFWMHKALALPSFDVSVVSPLLITFTFLVGEIVGAVVWSELESVTKLIHQVMLGLGLATTLLGCGLMVCEMARRTAASATGMESLRYESNAVSGDESMNEPFIYEQERWYDVKSEPP